MTGELEDALLAVAEVANRSGCSHQRLYSQRRQKSKGFVLTDGVDVDVTV